MLKDYSIIDFKIERSRSQYFMTVISLQLEFYIKDVDFYLAKREDNVIVDILKSYNLDLEDILIDNLIGLS